LKIEIFSFVFISTHIKQLIISAIIQKVIVIHFNCYKKTIDGVVPP